MYLSCVCVCLLFGSALCLLRFVLFLSFTTFSKWSRSLTVHRVFLSARCVHLFSIRLAFCRRAEIEPNTWSTMKRLRRTNEAEKSHAIIAELGSVGCNVYRLFECSRSAHGQRAYRAKRAKKISY